MRGSNLTLTFNDEIIYDDTSFIIEDNDKVGVVGVNGAGKTTLFKVILGSQELDSGKIINKKTVGYLPQEIIVEDESITVLEYLESGRPIKKLEHELEKLYIEASTDPTDKTLKKISKVQEKLEYYDCYKYESILLKIIENMDIDINLLDMKLKDLSGGQKSKIAFARLLYSKSEILLLDEPTNHLDEKTRTYVENYLKNYRGMVLVISHDVKFLNNIVNKIMYVNKVTHKISVYDGNYDTYKKKLELEQKLKEKRIQEEEKEIKELQAFVKKAQDASRTNHALKKMGKDREKKLEKYTMQRSARKARLDVLLWMNIKN